MENRRPDDPSGAPPLNRVVGQALGLEIGQALLDGPGPFLGLYRRAVAGRDGEVLLRRLAANELFGVGVCRSWVFMPVLLLSVFLVKANTTPTATAFCMISRLPPERRLQQCNCSTILIS